MGDNIASNVVATMLEPIRDSLYAFIRLQFGYLVHCKKNFKDLEDEVNKLRDAMASVQTRVDAALNNAEVIEDNVSRWLDKVQSSLTTMEEDMDRLVQGTQNLKCLHVCSRYRLGKEGKKKQTVVTKLIEDGKFDTVAHRPPLTGIWQRSYSTSYESFQSRELVFKEIMKALKDDGTYKIGIYGMPGVGKTRMMKEVAQQAEKDKLFDEIVEIVFTQIPNRKKIQQKLAEGLNLYLDKQNEDARKGLLLNRLKNGKKILALVDDIWNDQIKLEDIGFPTINDQTKGCKILLTSRQSDMCEAMGVPENVNFQIGVLLKDESWSLLVKKVGDSIEADDMRSVAEAVCEECACLPLAILAVGGALMKKSKHAWEDALKQLKNSNAKNIARLRTKLYSPIELSYNYLEHADAKAVFLLCCLFGEDVEISIDDLVSYGVGLRLLQGVDTMEEARNRAHVLVTTLKTSSLLLEGSEKDLVKIHDVIRDVAIWIASKEEDAKFLVKAGVRKWPDEDDYKQCKAISLTFNDECVLPDDLECSELHTLMLEFRNVSSEVPSSFFKVMEKLKVLQLRNMQISELPSSLKNLRMLRLYDCQLVNVAFLKELKKLEILCIEDSDLKELAPEIGQLTCLRLLDLSGCDELNVIPSGVISSLTQLEELYIPGEFYQWEVEDNASLNELNSLKRLFSLQVYVPDVMLLPPLIEPLFKSLNRFKVSIGSERRLFLDFWNSGKNLSSATRKLKVVGHPLKKELNILMEKAEELYLGDLKVLENVPKGLCGSVSFCELSLLKVVDCKSMIYLFSSATARSLSQLQELTISGCEIMEEIVRDDQEVIDGVIIFHHLKKIELKDLPKLRSFYTNMKKSTTGGECNTSTLVQALFNDKVAFPALEELEISGLKSLTAIWEGQSQSLIVKEAQVSFQSLRFMSVRGCDELVNVIVSNVLPSLQKLEKLKVIDYNSVKEIVTVERGQLGEEDVVHDEIIVFRQLKYLQLEDLPNLKSFTRGSKEDEETVDQIIPRVEALFNHKVSFPALEELRIENLKSLTAIWDNQLCPGSEGQDSFQLLRLIHVKCSEKLVNVIPPNAIPMLHNLESLQIVSCDSVVSGVEMVAIEEGDDEIIMFPQLKNLELKYLSNLKSFCYNTAGSKEQEECDGSKEEQEECGGKILVFSQLRTMILEALPKLSSFCCSRRGGEELVVEESNIDQRKALFNHKVKFPCLEELFMKKLDSLEEIWHSTISNDSVSKLRKLELEWCPKLLNVASTELHISFQNLEEVEVLQCESLQEVFKVEGSKGAEGTVVFPQLRTMRLEDLPKLSSFCCSTRGGEELVVEESNFPQQQALFNNKVAFLALEKLSITNLESLEAIWNDQSQSLLLNEAEDNFQFLKCIEVNGCNKMVNVIPANVLPRLQNLTQLHISKSHNLINVFSSSMAKYLVHLQELKVTDCEKMEEIVAVERGLLSEDGEEDLGHDEIIVFHQLKHLTLQQLPNLNSFCSICGSEKEEEIAEQNFGRMEALFNYKVRFPALEALKIGKLKRLTVIWDKQLFLGSEAQESFRQLRFVTVHECDKLVNVIPPNAFPMLQNLESLKVVSCDSMVFGAEVTAIEEGSVIQWFPQLKKLKLKKLQNLKSFCYSNIGGSKEEEEEEEGGGGKTLVFPQLNTIRLEELPKLSGICCSRRGEEESVLKDSNIPQQEADLFNYKVEFPILENLELGDGSNFEGIWKNGYKVGSMKMEKYNNLVNACTLLQWFEIVEDLSLESCDSLEVIFNLEGLGAIERKAIVSSQAKELRLIDLPKLERIWIMESQGLLGFHNLTTLRVYKCNSLRYVFSLSIARGLTQLRKLTIRECSVMEEIVRNEGQGEEIVFFQLEYLWLWELPNLTCFCGTNNAFNFPSLKKVSLKECPKLQTFTSGGITTSGGISFTIDFEDQGDVSDLNSHVQRWLVGKGKEQAEDN